jgi:anti-sigma B factor antagonist
VNPLTVSSRDEADRVVIELAGELDLYTAAGLRGELARCLAAGRRHLVIDMLRVRFTDSSGLGVLVGGLKRVLDEEGSLVLVIDEPSILRTFQITGLDKVFTIHPTLAEALP